MKNKIFFIAEIGVNHNKKLGLALKTIRAAAKAGANAVKFQTFSADQVISNNKDNYTYNTLNGKKTENMFSMFKRLELPKSWYVKLIREARRNKVIFFSSTGDEKSAIYLKKIGVKLMKIASPDLTNYPLLKCVAKLGNETIISTGMGSENEISEAVKIFKKHKTTFCLMHCVSMYPTPKKNANLLRICKLKEKYKNINIGYSDHTLGVDASVLATILGARVIEKHFTLNKKFKGPDHHISADPKEFKLLVTKVNEAFEMLGKKTIEPSSVEKKNRKLFRRSITANFNIQKGSILTKDNIILKRPASGAHPKYLDKVLGKRVKKNILRNQKIKLKDLIF